MSSTADEARAAAAHVADAPRGRSASGHRGRDASRSPSEGDRRDRHRSSSRFDDDRRRESYRRDDDRHHRSRSRYEDDRERDRERDRDRDRDYRSSRGYSRERDRDDRRRDDYRSSSRRRHSPSPDRRSSERSSERGTGSSVMELLQRIVGGGMMPMVMPQSAPPPAPAPAPAPLAPPQPAAVPAPAAPMPVSAPAPIPVAVTASGVPPPPNIAAALARFQAATSGGGMPVAAAPAMGAPAPAPLVNKALRELYIGGIPHGSSLTSDQLRDFLNMFMVSAGLVLAPGNPILQARVAENAAFAFVELRSPEETNLLLNVGNVPFSDFVLKLGRPKGYAAAMQAAMMSGAMPGAAPGMGGMPAPGMGGMGMPGMGMGGMPGMGMGGMSGMGMGMGGMPGMPGMPGMGGMPAAPAPLSSFGYSGAASFMGAPSAAPAPAPAPAVAAAPGPAPDSVTDVLLAVGVPDFINEEQLRSIFEVFGAITQCVKFVPSEGAHASKACALLQFADNAMLDTVISSMSDVDLGDFSLKLSRALYRDVAGKLPGFPPLAPPPAVPSTASSGGAAAVPETHVLKLSGVVVARDLSSPEEISDIREDVAEECGRYGRVLEVRIPPLTVAQQAVSAGETVIPVYVVFASASDASATSKRLEGRKFDGRPVSVTFVSEADAASACQGDSAAPSAAHSGGEGNHYAGVCIPPPLPHEQADAYTGSAAAVHATGAPEDGMALPPVPAAADLD